MIVNAIETCLMAGLDHPPEANGQRIAELVASSQTECSEVGERRVVVVVGVPKSQAHLPIMHAQAHG